MNNIDKFRSRRSRPWRSRPRRIRVSAKELQEIAEELVAVKDMIYGLQETERLLKKEVFRKLESYEYLEVLFGKGNDYVAIVEKCKTTAAASLNRSRVYRYMTSRYGSLAADELLEDCLVKKKAKETIYVRVFPNNKESMTHDPDIAAQGAFTPDSFDPLLDFDDNPDPVVDFGALLDSDDELPF